MMCSTHGRRRTDSSPKREPVPVKRYVHPICCTPASSGSCQAVLEEILAAIERQNALLEALCRTAERGNGANL